MTAAELKNRLLRLVGVDAVGSAPAHVVDDVVMAINQAYQVLWQDVPRDRRIAYTRRVDTLTFTAGTATAEIDEDVQSVVAPVRRLPDLKPMRVLRHRSEIDNYGFLTGRTTTDVTAGTPKVYYLESIAQSGADGIKNTLCIAPTPSADTELRVEVEIQAPSVTAANLCAAGPIALKIANQYAETLLYPIAAYYLATQSTWFRRPDALPPIKEEYERAKARLGIVDPTTTAAKASVKPRDR